MSKKKIFFIVCLFAGLVGTPKVYADGDDVPLESEIVDPTLGEGGHPRTPIQPPHASIDGHTFYVNSSHGDFVVKLIDESGLAVYVTLMPSAVSSIQLPSYLSGNYTIQLFWGNWLFFGYITL